MFVFAKTKEQRAEDAAKHLRAMRDKYTNEIARSVANTRVYGGPNPRPARRVDKEKDPAEVAFSLVDADTVSAAFSEHNGRTAVVNFASYLHPGGGYLSGSMAQEEALCAESDLYNVLSAYDGYYAWNAEHKNKSLYTDRALYSPEIIFVRGSEVEICDVITCAAPNLRAHLQHTGDSAHVKENNSAALERRIRFIRDISEENRVDTLIFGAFGCGVFGQDPLEVARMIRESFAKSSLQKTVLAVPGNLSKANFRAFASVFPENRKS